MLFDADGTLLDSLPPHVAFCAAAAARLGETDELVDGLRAAVEDTGRARALAAAPMDAFLRKAGFAERNVAAAVAEYEASFASEFPVGPFDGVHELLAELRARDVRLAVVSSNTSANVAAGLGALAESLEFTLGIDNGPRDKRDAVAEALERLGVDDLARAVYVGDTSKDETSASANGIRFFGAGYGFEDLAPLAARGVPVAPTVGALRELLLEAVRG